MPSERIVTSLAFSPLKASTARVDTTCHFSFGTLATATHGQVAGEIMLGDYKAWGIAATIGKGGEGRCRFRRRALGRRAGPWCGWLDALRGGGGFSRSRGWAAQGEDCTGQGLAHARDRALVAKGVFQENVGRVLAHLGNVGPRGTMRGCLSELKSCTDDVWR